MTLFLLVIWQLYLLKCCTPKSYCTPIWFALLFMVPHAKMAFDPARTAN